MSHNKSALSLKISMPSYIKALIHKCAAGPIERRIKQTFHRDMCQCAARMPCVLLLPSNAWNALCILLSSFHQMKDAGDCCFVTDMMVCIVIHYSPWYLPSQTWKSPLSLSLSLAMNALSRPTGAFRCICISETKCIVRTVLVLSVRLSVIIWTA